MDQNWIQTIQASLIKFTEKGESPLLTLPLITSSKSKFKFA